MVSGTSGCKALEPFEVQKEALEEMGQVEDAVAATLEHLDLIVEPFHKATVVPRKKVIGDFLHPFLERLPEAVVTAQAAGSHPPLPVRELVDRGFFGKRCLKNARQLLPYSYAWCKAGV